VWLDIMMLDPTLLELKQYRSYMFPLFDVKQSDSIFTKIWVGVAMPKRRRTVEPLNPTLELGVLSRFMGFHLRLAQITAFRDFEVAVAQFGLSPAQYAILVLIDNNPGLTQTRLAEAILLDRSSLVPVLDRLEQESLVERRDSPGDRRSNSVWLTAKGRNLLKQVTPLVTSHEVRLAAGFAKEEKEQLLRYLQRIQQNLKKP
jgi:DNA-binding MarR family transcriptional regulator